MLVALGTLPILLLELELHELPSGDRMFVRVVNIVVLIVFGTDYVVELALAKRRWDYVRREWLALVIVLSCAAAVVPSLVAVGSLRVLRALRPLRAVIAVVRAVAVGGVLAREGRQRIRSNAFGFAAGSAFMTWLASAAAFTVAEDVGVDGTNGSGFADALWWSAATITTVGYGDIAPVTLAGRAIAVATMIVGISVFAIVAARIASFLVADD